MENNKKKTNKKKKKVDKDFFFIRDHRLASSFKSARFLNLAQLN